MPGKSCSPPYHIHAAQTETFVVKEGTFTFLIHGKQRDVKAGDPQVVVHSPTPHSWWNAHPSQPGLLEFTFTPGGRAEEFFRTIMGLGQVRESPV